MALKLFEFVEQFLMDTYLLKTTQFKKTGSKGKTFISLRTLIINFHFRNEKPTTFFVNYTLLLFDSGVCLPFNNRNAMNLKINHKSNREKLKLSVYKFYKFFLKKNIKNQ